MKYACAFAVVLACASTVSAAPVITATVSPDNGEFLYEYQITTDDPSVAIDTVAMLADGVDELSITSPFGWIFSGAPDQSVLLWFALAAEYAGSSARPLIGFGFRSPFSPATSQLFVSFTAPDLSGHDSYLLETKAPGAAAVPEPSTGILACIAAAMAMTRHWRGDRRRCRPGLWPMSPSRH